MREEQRGDKLVVTVEDVSKEIDQILNKYQEQKHTGELVVCDSTDSALFKLENGMVHCTTGPAAFLDYGNCITYCYYYNNVEYGNELRNDIGTDVIDCEELVFLDKYMILNEYEKDGIKFYDLLKEDGISFEVPNIKGLIHNSKEEYHQKNDIYHSIGCKFYSSFDEFETEFWNKFIDGTLNPKNELLQTLEKL